MSRVILHLDLDAFYCSVEEIQDPTLIGQPFAVGGKPNERGVVASCSYAARALGVRSAMPMSKAVQLCRNLIIVPVRHDLYSEYSEQVMKKLKDLTPLVEQISIDEAFLDLSNLDEDPARRALDLQADIRIELQLPSSIGLAANKLVAKIATEVGKKSNPHKNQPPFGFTHVPTGTEAQFLAPLPVDMLWGVGPKTFAKLTELGIHTIGDLANWPEKEMANLFGENGRDLWRHARGIDDRQIVTEYETKSVSQETTFNVDEIDEQKLEATLHEQAFDVARQLKRNDLAGKTVKIKIRWSNFTTLTRQLTLPTPTNDGAEIYQAAVKLLKAVRQSNQAVRLIGVGVSGIGAPIRQLGLWDLRQRKP
ncbi:MAG: DNA polymerase IV [Anaerolineales bacterium]|nr:DNA polymerase IV [Anaerolineales bacterium]